MSTMIWSQEDQKLIAKFIITEASINDVDVSETAIESKEYLVFYTVEGENATYLANYWVTSERQTYGKVYDMVINKYEETADTYKREEFTFSWRYAYGDNPDKKYTAKVNLTKIYKKKRHHFCYDYHRCRS
jgi:hypothetical protein